MNNPIQPPQKSNENKMKDLADLFSSDISESDVRHSSTSLSAISGSTNAGNAEDPLKNSPLMETLLGNPNIQLDEMPKPVTSEMMENSPASKAQTTSSPAHYEVDVQHYARYDKDEESGYTNETRKSLTYAAKTPFGRFIVDLLLILTRPGAFWKSQAEHPSTLGQLYWPHLITLVLLRAAAVMSGALLQYAINDIKIKSMLIETGIQTLLIFLMIGLFSLIISGFSTLMGSGFQFEKAHRFVAYSVTPIFVVGILSVLPIPYMDKICDIIAMPWAFLVLGAGILPFLKIKHEQAPTLTGIFCGMLLIMWGVIPMAIPRLIGLMV